MMGYWVPSMSSKTNEVSSLCSHKLHGQGWPVRLWMTTDTLFTLGRCEDNLSDFLPDEEGDLLTYLGRIGLDFRVLRDNHLGGG